MDVNHWNIPLYKAIRDYTGTDPLPFHMPGHKLGRGIPEMFLEHIEKLDLTEIPGTDNLHMPRGVIKEAQELAAMAFGSQKTYFLVNGSTVGLHAAISTICRPGQCLITGRDCHKSVINGMLLAGVIPYYILPEYSPEFGINTGINASTVERALNDVPDAVGVLITRPNYYGVCSDIDKIAEIVHRYGKILAVDEAHGPHLTFNPRLPASALAGGADICIQSAHKTLSAFTQGAYLHTGSEHIDLQRLEYFLDIFQTTSPSYIIMAFLDIAREVMQKNGEYLLNKLIDAIEAGYGGLTANGLKILGEPDLKGFRHDSTRIVINTSGIGITGYAAEKLLREKYRIQVEMSDLNNIVCIGTAADDSQSIEQLFSGLKKLKNIRPCDGVPVLPDFKGLELPAISIKPGDVLNAETERIPLKLAAGKTCREIISPYPPGMAFVCPGEEISNNMVEYLRSVISCGGMVQGIDENGCIAVVK